MFYDTFKQRKQIRFYDTENVPDFSIVQNALRQTYEITASKQNLIPYKIYVINNKQMINEGLYELSKGRTGTVQSNKNLLTAPYQFIYTARLVDDASEIVQGYVSKGELQAAMNPSKYRNTGQAKNTCIEIGMHSTILSTLLIEQGLGVAYTLCFDNWLKDKNSWIENGIDFIDDDVYFIMSAGYPSDEYVDSGIKKPPFENVMRYVG